MADPNMVLATVAQIAATFVAIVAGFLLTIGLSRLAERQRLNSIKERSDKLKATLKEEKEADAKKERTEQAQFVSSALSIRYEWLRGHIDDAEHEAQSRQLLARKRAADKARLKLIKSQIDRSRVAVEEHEEAIRLIEEQEVVLRIVAGGLGLLALLALVGIGIPLYLLSINSGDISHASWIAQRGTLVLVVGILGYISIVFTYSGPRGKDVTFWDHLDLIVGFSPTVILLLWPNTDTIWIGGAFAWLVAIVITARWVRYFWRRRRNTRDGKSNCQHNRPPSEADSATSGGNGI